VKVTLWTTVNQSVCLSVKFQLDSYGLSMRGALLWWDKGSMFRFWAAGVRPCSAIDRWKYFGVTSCLNLQGRRGVRLGYVVSLQGRLTPLHREGREGDGARSEPIGTANRNTVAARNATISTRMDMNLNLRNGNSATTALQVSVVGIINISWRHPLIAKVDTNFANKRRPLGRYSSLGD
jgi:hypothetical protein